MSVSGVFAQHAQLEIETLFGKMDPISVFLYA